MPAARIVSNDKSKEYVQVWIVRSPKLAGAYVSSFAPTAERRAALEKEGAVIDMVTLELPIPGWEDHAQEEALVEVKAVVVVGPEGEFSVSGWGKNGKLDSYASARANAIDLLPFECDEWSETMIVVKVKPPVRQEAVAKELMVDQDAKDKEW